jgi:hypothetical protein
MAQYMTTEPGEAVITMSCTPYLKKPKLITDIKIGRLHWAGHV